MSLGTKTRVTSPKIPDAAYTALDRLGQPGAHLILFGNQNYILSEKITLTYHLSEKTLTVLQSQEWLTYAQRNDQGHLECRLTPAGWHLVNQRKAARSGKFVQLHLALPA